MVPIFIHIFANGDIWVSTKIDDNPSDGTALAVYRVANPHVQKLCTLTGTANSNLAISGGATTTKWTAEKN